MAPPAHEPIRPVRPAESIGQLRCCLCNGTTVEAKGRVELLAPFEDSLAGMDEGEVHIEEDHEEAAPARHSRSPSTPSKDEEEQHRADHYPFRSWCRFCIMGRGVGQPHSAVMEESKVPLVGLDYFFITSEGVQRRDELACELTEEGEKEIVEARRRGEIIKCLLVRCLATKNVFAHIVPQKGADEEGYCAGLVVADVQWLGHTRVILKSDNEGAVLTLRRRVGRLLKMIERMENVQEESSAAYDSQSNGGVEVGVKLVRGMFRTLKLCLEARLGKYLPISHAITAWLLEHACTILNARARGSDGHTPWQRVKGRSFRQLLLGFGECVLYKLPSKGPHSNPDGNMGGRWLEGVFLGYSRSSNTYTVATIDGVANVRSIYRRPAENRWNFERVARIAATPWSTREKPEVGVEFADKNAESAEARGRASTPLPQAFRINYADLEEHGFTRECQQCEYNQFHRKSKTGLSHTATCRKRLLDALMTTPAGRRRLETYEEKIDHAIADRGPDFDWETGRQRPSEAAAEAAATTPTTVEQEQPRRIIVTDPTADEVQRAPASREVVQVRADEIPREFPDQRPLEDDVQEEMEEESEDTEMGYLGSKSDPVLSVLLMQLGNVESTSGVRGALAVRADEAIPAETPKAGCHLDTAGTVGMMHDKTSKHVVSEVYSPPRITLEIKKGKYRNLASGIALDLTVNDPDDGRPWDFSLKSKRDKAREMLQQSKPLLLIGSPMCTAFSTWQHLNWTRSKRPADMEKAYVQACVHMEFVAQLYLDQLAEGRYFLHEHPKFATSWELECMRRLRLIPGVSVVRADQCQYGAEAPRGPHKGSPVLKPIGFMSNSLEVLRELSRRCTGTSMQCSRPGGGKHTPCAGSICKEMAKYPRELCRAVLRGITAQLRADGRLQPGCYGVQMADDESGPRQLYGPEQGYSGRFKDDMTGQVLRDDLVVEARKTELEFFDARGVWIKVPIQRAFERTGRPPISARWVDINKGDENEPNHRSRYVARQMKALDTSGASYFAPAPPLEALKTILSLSMTRCGLHQPIWDPKSKQRQQISSMDVVRAYLNAKIDRALAPSFVELPPEDPDRKQKCGELLRHLYGTRPAADGWQEEYSTMLIRLGFTQGTASANVFEHRERKVAVSVHGDDLTATGPADALDWYENAVSAEYEVKIGPRLGPGENDAKEMRVLNRVVTWHDDRVEYEADPRQAERLIEECGLTGSNPMGTPGAKTTFQDYQADEGLEKSLHTPFRGSAARSNYLSADRVDLQFAGKEVCRSMSEPTKLSWKALKRIGRYLCGRPRLVYVYRRQEIRTIDVYVDTDWAGCVRTRKSTSGGVVMLGRHCIKHWSSTQPSVSLSSGEAEFYGVVRGAGQGLGYQALLKDLGVSAPLRVWTDSSAALGICSRQGLGKLRHLDTHTLWVQQAVRSRRLELKKVLGEENPADLLTKHSISKDRLEKLVELYDCHFRQGRAQSAPARRTGMSEKVTIAEADAKIQSEWRGDAQGLNNVGGGCGPRMPHNELDPRELEEAYPSLEAVDDLGLDDLTRLEDESLYSAGMVVVQGILHEMATTGRTRYAGQVDATVRGGEATKADGSRVAMQRPTLSRRSAGSRAAAPGSPSLSLCGFESVRPAETQP